MSLSIIVEPNHSPNKFTEALPDGYGEKRDYPKIDLFVDGHYYGSTTWAHSLRCALNGLLAKTIMSAGTQVLAKFSKK
jgi:hypothetical protein